MRLFRNRRGVWLSIALFAMMLLSAWKFDHTNTTPYKLSYPDYFNGRTNISADNLLTDQGVYLGRLLFYETRLSVNDHLSCGNCHLQQKAFTDGEVFSRGFDSTVMERNTMSLANLLWVRNFFWDGRVSSLESQVVVPMTGEHEMGQPLELAAKKLQKTDLYPPLFKAAFGSDIVTGDYIKKALAQFLRTLISAGSRYDAYLRKEYRLTPAEANGLALFFTAPDPSRNIRGANCSRCHGGAALFTELYHNNGLDSIPGDIGRQRLSGMAIDKGRFRTVTLRNIALTAPYMHDGRFKTLNEVVDHYSDHIVESEWLSTFLRNNSNNPRGTQLALTKKEKTDLIAFLNLLTDSSFISDKRYADPFSANGK